MENQIKNPNLIKNIDGKNNLSNNTIPFFNLIIFLFLAILVGIGSGFLLVRIKGEPNKIKTSSSSSTEKGAKIGVTDKKTFKDKAEGILREGGVDGEGNFHLERNGGESQNVYLTSTTVDLSPFVGKKIRVWGATFTAEKAGWLMDVGLVEVL